MEAYKQTAGRLDIRNFRISSQLKTYFSPFKTGSESINEEKSLFKSSLDNLTSSVRGFELKSCATCDIYKYFENSLIQ